MTLNVTDAQFASDFAIDKIQSWSTFTDSSPGLSTGYRIVVPPDTNLPTLLEVVGSIANPYAKRGLPNLSWSVDLVNWYPNGGQIVYFDAVHAQYTTQIAAYISCSDSLINFNIVTGLNATQTIYLQLAVDNPT